MKIILNGQETEVDEGKLPFEIWKNEIEASGHSFIACNINHEVKSLKHTLKEGDQITLLNRADRDGNAIYIRGILYVMAMAFHRKYPEIRLTVKYQLSGAMLCEGENAEVTEEMLEKVKEEMQKIIDADLPIKKIAMTKEEAEAFYEKEKTVRGKLQLNNKAKEQVSLYFCEEYYNYFFGVMPISTGFLPFFDLENYRDGFLVRYPSRKDPDCISR